MLENHGQQHHRIFLPRQNQVAGADAELGASGDDLGHHVAIRAGFGKFDVQPGLTVIAFFERGVIPGKLELVFPFQLQVNVVQRAGSA